MVDSVRASGGPQLNPIERHDENKPMTMPSSVAGQSSQPAMESETPVAMVLRQRPVAQRVESSRTSAANTAENAVARQRPGAVTNEDMLSLVAATFAKVFTGIIAASAAYRGMRNPMDFVEHPGQAIMGTLTLSQRADANTLSHGNSTVLSHFGQYIPGNSACYKAKAEVVFDLPSNIAGQFYSDSNEVKVAAYHSFGSHPNHHARHEFVHCYTHPDFMDKTKRTDNKALLEGVTEHITDKMPHAMWPLDRDASAYHKFKLDNGKTWTQAANEIEQKVGEETLIKAVFSGDRKAISDVSAAAASIYPKAYSNQVWNSIGIVTALRGTQELAECYVGALEANKVEIPNAYSKPYLPAAFLGDISTEDRQKMAEQAKACQERMGDVFNAAFFGFDKDGQKDALKAVREEVKMYWQPVLKEQ
ncbi:hypothetical protein [Pseudomonas sp. PIC25]|uniref:hypothetical protein n=1 Tax=Pseudomonas sp. PIC25 TaxID=1958773 RepID=UPI00117B538B|nr:hypothetical protein [Pseudomonas sp. PIC25]